MEVKSNSTSLNGAEKKTSFADFVTEIEKTCRNCKPLTPITCVSGCRTWRLKNQLRNLHEKTKDPGFMINLLNTIKNKRRLQLLEMISKEQHSVEQIQRELRGFGFNHSQQTIVQEYLDPLIAVGLADEYQNKCHATLFGRMISDATKDSHELEDLLSPHSECYEEIALDLLMKGSTTYENLKEIIPEKSVARVLSRLRKAMLAETCAGKDYIFFFTTKRKPDESDLSQTEKRVYDKIPKEGIPVRRLAKEAGISARRTYKYLRKLKGKKLIFTRKKPLSYSITATGTKIGTMLKAVHNLTAQALTAASRLVEDEQTCERMTLKINPAVKKRKDEQVLPLTTLRPLEQDSSSFEDTRGLA